LWVHSSPKAFILSTFLASISGAFADWTLAFWLAFALKMWIPLINSTEEAFAAFASDGTKLEFK
jgi:hypothetical protein